MNSRPEPCSPLEAALLRVECGESGAADAELIRSHLAVAEMKLIQQGRELAELAGRLRVYQLESDAPLRELGDCKHV